MYSSPGARKSVDSLSPTLSVGHRGDFPFHGYTHMQSWESFSVFSSANGQKNSATWLPAARPAEGLNRKLYSLDWRLPGRWGELVRGRFRIGPECHINAFAAPDSEDRPPPTHRAACLECSPPSDRTRHTASDTHQHPTRRSIRIYSVLVASRCSIRAATADTVR